MKVKKNIKPNNLIHISNKYDILDTSYDDYVINIYYLSINKIQIIIRKINNTYGWDNDIKSNFSGEKYLLLFVIFVVMVEVVVVEVQHILLTLIPLLVMVVTE